MAITGPFVRTATATWSTYRYLSTYRQKPYTGVPLRHTSRGFNRFEVIANSKADGVILGQLYVNDETPLDERVAYRKAFDRAIKTLGQKANLGLALLEGKSSLAMAERRLLQLLGLFRGIITRNPRLIADAIGWSRQARKAFRKTKGQPLSQCYIEWLFGWAPLVQDIGTTVEILSRDFDVAKVVGTGSHTSNLLTVSGTSRAFGAGTETCKVGLKAAVSNPNLLLASQLGLTNLAATAWDAIPFSFLVNIFVPIGQYFSSWNPFMGWNITDVYVTSYKRAKAEQISVTWRTWHTREEAWRFERWPLTTLPTPSFSSRLKLPHFPDATSALSRIATLCSLLHLQMR